VAVTDRGTVVVGEPSLTAATILKDVPSPGARGAGIVAPPMLHVTNGDSTVPGIEATGVGGDVIAWRDTLHEGPLPAGLDAAGMRAVRARFLAACGWGEAESIEAELRARDERLATALRRDEVVVLWFEHDLYDQLQLLQVLDAVGAGDEVEAILPDRFLGAMQVDELAALWPQRAALRSDQVALARLAWEAVRAPGPQGIVALLNTHTAALPHLGAALRRHLEELPAVGDGLGRTERQALEAIAAGARTPHAVFLASQRAEEAPFLGDTWMWTRLAELGRGDGRLVQTTAGEPLGSPPPRSDADGFLAQELELTECGRAALSGDADRCVLVPLDRWIGGIHVTGPDPEWRWDRATDRPVSASGGA
jgi:hypothetical protein